MTDPAPRRMAEAVRLLFAELDSVCEQEREVRRRLRRLEHSRRRLGAALEPAISGLDPAEARALRSRLAATVHARLVEDSGPARTRIEAVLAYLSSRPEEVVKVADVTEALTARGFTPLPHGYASDTLKRFETHGIVTKIRYARYRVNTMHREIAGVQGRGD